MDMKYGTEKTTTTIDDEGSTITISKEYKDYTIMPPVMKEYRIRIKVKDQRQETEEYLKFSEQAKQGKLNPNFEIEHTMRGDEQGYYFVIKSYSEVVL